jgi:hypothetical protein
MQTELQTAAQSQRTYVHVVAPMMGKPYRGALKILFVPDKEAELVDLEFWHWGLVLQRWKDARSLCLVIGPEYQKRSLIQDVGLPTACGYSGPSFD